MFRVLVPQHISGTVPPADASIVRLDGRSMGCGWSVLYVHADAADCEQLPSGVQAVLENVVAQMSTWEPGSAITCFNHATPGTWLPLPEEFALVLACALHVAGATDGALDPTAGALVGLWGFGPGAHHLQPDFELPGEAAIETARKLAGWRRLQVDTHAMQIRQPGGLQLDLSAVAKGFAVDAVSRFLREAGVDNHLVEIGGELRGAGMKPDGQPWWVDVQGPPHVRGARPVRIALHALSVATSGDYQQGFTRSGRHYSHCIDSRNGYPVDNGVCSVTVLHRECMLADAWSTALMVLGPEDGLAAAEREHIAAQWLVRAGDGVDEHCSSAYHALIA